MASGRTDGAAADDEDVLRRGERVVLGAEPRRAVLRTRGDRWGRGFGLTRSVSAAQRQGGCCGEGQRAPRG